MVIDQEFDRGLWLDLRNGDDVPDDVREMIPVLVAFSGVFLLLAALLGLRKLFKRD